MALFHSISAQFLFERPSRTHSIDHYVPLLEKNGRKIATKIATMRHTAVNHTAVTYLIAVERWGQQRLRIAQGAPFRNDDYRAYRPPKETPWSELVEMFEAARRGTVTLASDLCKRNTNGKVLHDVFGEMSVRAWLHYLNWHPKFALIGVR